jgi:hypothetical protein
MFVVQIVTAIGYAAIAAFLRPPKSADKKVMGFIIAIFWIMFFAFCAATHLEMAGHLYSHYEPWMTSTHMFAIHVPQAIASVGFFVLNFFYSAEFTLRKKRQ